MKNYKFQIGMLLVVLLLASCQEKEELGGAKGSVSLKACIENGGTRTSVDEEGHVSWVETDAVGVFGKQTKNAKFQSTGAGTSIKFVGEMSAQDEPSLAYYPYDESASLDGNTLHFTLPSEYTYTGESNAPMLGVKQEDGSFSFKHLCGLLKVTIKNMPENAKRLFVVSEGTEEKEAPFISGDVTVNDVTAEGATFNITKNGSREVSIDLENVSAQETYTFYIPVPVGEYPKLSVKLEMNDGVIYLDKSISDVKMERTKMLEMPVVDAEKEESSITAILRGTVDIENPEGLIVRTMIDEQVLDSNEFSVEVLSNGIPQIVYVTDKNDKILMMARTNKFGEIQINSETTAIALISIMPSFVYDTYNNYDKIIDLIKKSPNYIDIIKGLEQIISTKNDVFESGDATLWTHIGTLINNLYEQPSSRSEIEYINKEHLKVTSAGKIVRICNTKLYPPYECIVTNAKEEDVYKKIIFSANSYGVVDMVTNNWGNDICGSIINFPLGNKENGEYKFTLEISSTYLFLDLMIDACNAIFNGVISFENIDSPFLGELFPKAYNYASTTLPYLLRSDAGFEPWDVFSDLCLLIIEDALDGGLEGFCEYYINYITKIDNYVNYDESWLENYPNYKEEWENKKKNLIDQKEKFKKNINIAKVLRKILAVYEGTKATSNFIKRCYYACQATEEFSFNLCNYSEYDEIVSCTETDLYISGGNEQEGYPKQKLELPLKVFVKSNFDDGSATTLTDYQGIKFEVVSGGGYVDKSFVSVDEKTGIASTSWTLGESGEQKVRVVAYGNVSKQELSEPVYFTASFADIPISISTTEATNITQTTATLSGNIQGYEADDFMHRYGIIYSTDTTPTASNGTIVYSDNIQEDGNYSVDVASLTENTTYYYRAFVIDGGNYIYGDVKSFTTLSDEMSNMSDRDILIAFYNANGGVNWSSQKNWCTDAPLDDWTGVATDEDGFVIQFSIPIVNKRNVTGDANLSGLSRLETLSLEGAQITSLDVSGCSNLTHLSCWNCEKLASVDLEGCNNLEYVNFLSCKLPTLDVSHCPDLKELNCSENEVLASLNINGCGKLEYVDISNNKISNALDFSGNVNLTRLFCDDNELPSLNVKGCTNLNELMCISNQLSSLDISDCTELTLLSCGGNQLSALDLSANLKLQSLACGMNRLSSLDISNLKKLKGLTCNNNQLTELNISSNTAITSLRCPDNQITSLDLRNLSELKTLDCYNNKLTKLQISGLTNLYYMDCENNLLTDLNFAGCTGMQYVECNDNKLTTIDVSQCPELLWLYCHNNVLTSLNVTANTLLERLNCSNNSISSLNFTNNKNVIDLRVGYNLLETIDVSNMLGLKYFYTYASESLKQIYISTSFVVDNSSRNHYLWGNRSYDYTEDAHLEYYQYPEFIRK